MGVWEQITCPVSKIKLGPEARYKSRYFHLSFQLPADPTILASVDMSLRSYAEFGVLHSVAHMRVTVRHTGSSAVVVSCKDN